MTFTAFFGDGEKAFALPFPLLKELESKTGTSIGVLIQHLRHMQFSATELSETIRLALIGGGTDPKTAADLVAVYVEKRPLAETLPIAFGIVETVWFGSPTETETVADLAPAQSSAATLRAQIAEAYQDVKP